MARRASSRRRAVFAVVLLAAALAGGIAWRMASGGAAGHGGTATSGLAGEGVVRVVSWNMEWFPGGSPDAGTVEKKRHMELAREALARLRPDILLAQEVRNESAVGEALVDVPGHKVAVISRFPGPQQLCIAGRLPAEAAWFKDWETDGKDDPPRGFACAAFRLPSGRLLLVYTVHLKSNAGGDPTSNRAKREEAVRQLLEHITTEVPKYKEPVPPAILIAGDFNTDPDASQFAGEQTIPMLGKLGFEAVLDRLPRKQRITWPAKGRYPDAAFDHVFARGLTVKSIVVPTGYDDRSDHRPVIVDIVDKDE